MVLTESIFCTQTCKMREKGIQIMSTTLVTVKLTIGVYLRQRERGVVQVIKSVYVVKYEIIKNT